MTSRTNSHLDRHGWELFEHTADVGLRVVGRNLAELLQHAADGFVELLVDPRTVESRRSLEVSCSGHDPEELLVSWLEEILFAFEAEHLAPARAEVLEVGPDTVRGRITGETFDGKRHEIREVVKAVTYHNLAVRTCGDRLEASVIIDV